ncbi:hypothetical protein GS891_11945 [Rhodococcus hoagii]|nr:hypothetical protein [Prescottella equi]
MVEHFLTAKRRSPSLSVRRAPAKTTAATVIARAWKTPMERLSPSGRRPVLQRCSGRRSPSRDGRSRMCSPAPASHPDRHRQWRSLLVDEAGMASARDLADLTRIATEGRRSRPPSR